MSDAYTTIRRSQLVMVMCSHLRGCDNDVFMCCCVFTIRRMCAPSACFCVYIIIIIIIICAASWSPAAPTNWGQVVVAEIDHADGLARPRRREQKLRQHETAEMSWKSELSQAGGNLMWKRETGGVLHPVRMRRKHRAASFVSRRTQRSMFEATDMVTAAIYVHKWMIITKQRRLFGLGQFKFSCRAEMLRCPWTRERSPQREVNAYI